MSIDLKAEKSKEDVKDLCDRIPVLSEYAKSLDAHVKRRYLEKISVIRLDPATVPNEQLNPECLPPIEATDLLSYLVLDTSYYTKQQFKAYKSLEAFNEMVSGFVTSVSGLIVSGKHVVAAKVRHSQRMNDPLISVWIVTESDGTIISAHCLGCKAGLAQTCSHVASVMFYIEAWTRINGKLACTQVKCTWLLPSYVNEVPYAKVADINFKSAKKMKQELDMKIDSLGENMHAEANVKKVQHPSKSAAVDAPTSAEMTVLYHKLNGCSIKPVALSLIDPFAEQFISISRSIPKVTDLYDSTNLDLQYPDLIKKCMDIKIELSDGEMKSIEKDTIKQAKGAGFFRHRAGRIGASVSGTVSHSNLAQPSQSLIKSICYPHLYKVNTKAVKHGCKHEEDAIVTYENEMKKYHINFVLTRCGIIINK